MAAGKNEPDDDDLTPKELCHWLHNEIEISAKAHELRAKELTGILNACESGEISPAETFKRIQKYEHRWEEAMPGIFAVNGISDEKIIAKVDEARGKYISLEDIREKENNFLKKYGLSRKPQSDGHGR